MMYHEFIMEKVFKVAIVEDEREDRETIVAYLERYKKEVFKLTGEKISFIISEFENGVLFLTNYCSEYDVVFMDIQMPHINGMDTAVKLRTLDSTIKLVFITNMVNYAVSGYSVDASGFIVKPISYYSFNAIMAKVLKAVARKGDEIVIKTANMIKKVQVQSIVYVEVRDHKTIYHTLSGDLEIWDSLKEQEKKLPSDIFMRSSEAHLVNLKFVDEIGNDFVNVNGVKIPLSRSKKQKFMNKMLEYHGESI